MSHYSKVLQAFNGWCKINIDGAYNEQTNDRGAGFLLHLNDGTCLVA